MTVDAKSPYRRAAAVEDVRRGLPRPWSAVRSGISRGPSRRFAEIKQTIRTTLEV
jgi:hypothetical protein